VRTPDDPDPIRLIRGVRQSRRFAPDPVSEDALGKLLQIARWTGSSKNTQPWHFIVVTDKELLGRIGQLRAPIGWVEHAPLGIAIVLDGARPTTETYDEGRVSERLLIAAHSLGLGGGVAWYGDASQEAEAKRILGIPVERVAHSMVVIGHPVGPSEGRPGRAAGRRPLSEIVSYGRWGGKKA
jgi:nitroreductase